MRSGYRVVNGLLKVTACVYRPWIRDPRIVPDSDALATATGYSFPSGHSMNAASLYGGGAIRKELPRILRVSLAIIFVLIAFSRNFLGVHTPQDILVGSAAGLLVMWLTMKLMERIEADPKMDIPVMCAAIVIAIAVAVFAALKTYPEDYDAAGKLLVTGLLSYYAVTLILKAVLTKCFSGVGVTILTTFIQTFFVTFVFPWCIKRWEQRVL